MQTSPQSKATANRSYPAFPARCRQGRRPWSSVSGWFRGCQPGTGASMRPRGWTRAAATRRFAEHWPTDPNFRDLKTRGRSCAELQWWSYDWCWACNDICFASLVSQIAFFHARRTLYETHPLLLQEKANDPDVSASLKISAIHIFKCGKHAKAKNLNNFSSDERSANNSMVLCLHFFP